MLRLGLAKLRALGLGNAHPAGARRCDAHSARGTRSCDAATVAFGIRNVAEPALALAELARVLRPGGRLAILEFGQPRIPGIRTLYPGISATCCRSSAGWSRSTRAHIPTCRPRSARFRRRRSFYKCVKVRALRRVRAVPLTFGIVYLYVAETGIGFIGFRGSRGSIVRGSLADLRLILTDPDLNLNLNLEP